MSILTITIKWLNFFRQYMQINTLHYEYQFHFILYSIHYLFLTSTFDKQKVYCLNFHLTVHKYELPVVSSLDSQSAELSFQ